MQRPVLRNAKFHHRFFSSPAGSEFIEHSYHENNDASDGNGTTNDSENVEDTKENNNAHTVISNESEYLEEILGGNITYITNDNNTYENAHDNESKRESEINILRQHRESHHHLRASSPLLTPLDAYLFGPSNPQYNDEVPEMDAITQLQSEHDAYIAIVEATHKQEIQNLRKEIMNLKATYTTSPANQELRREVEQSLVSIRIEAETTIRAQVEDERKKEREEMELQFKAAMVKEVERITEAVREEAKSQLQTQLQSMRAQVEEQIRGSLQTETERKVRLALVQQMRPQIRVELEEALRMEIRTAYSQEIRKEVEASLIPDLEKRITHDYKTKHARAHSAQKEQAEAALQTQLATAKKDMEDRIRRDAEAKVARKVAKQVETEVRVRLEKMKQEVRAECEAEARKHTEATLAQLKQERAEIARLRSVESLRRTREDAVQKDAEAEFQKKVAEFRRHVQEEETRIARMKAVVQWREEHVRRPTSSIPESPSPSPSPSPPLPSTIQKATPTRKSSSTPPPPAISPTPTPPTPMVSTTIPSITRPPSNPSPPPPLNLQQTTHSRSPSPTIQSNHLNHTPYNELHVQLPPKSQIYTSKPSVAFDFTFDVKLIAAKLISDARDILQPQGGKLITELPRHSSVSPVQPSSILSPPTPSSRTPSPIRAYPQASPPYSLGHIATEQRAQNEFETQPPLIPPQGTLGARLRVLLPRLYQLWDESEISHVVRRDFTNALRTMDVSTAERRVAMEISRLRKALPDIQKEMAIVTRRENVKAKLAREGEGMASGERGQLQAELRRLTTAVLSTISAWEGVHGIPFMYRGFPYRALLSDSSH